MRPDRHRETTRAAQRPAIEYHAVWNGVTSAAT